MLVIPATQEVEIKRISTQTQSGEMVVKTILKISNTKQG
jgi:hypothetical protein